MEDRNIKRSIVEVHKADAVLSKLLPEIQPRSDTTYRPSQFLLPFEHGGKRYVFHTLTKQCIEGVLPLSAKGGEEYDDLIKSQFLVPDGRDESAYYNSISSLMRAYHRKKGITGYTILPTTACNARCIYCFEEGMKPVTMTAEITEQTVRYILDHCEGNKISIFWFGGEPLMCPHIIDRICNGLRNAGIEYTSSMITNGSLITPEIVEMMKAVWNMSFIQVSMDGAEEDYVLRKNYRSYHDYYHKSMDAVNQIAAAGIRVDVRCNVDEDNLDRLPKFLTDLSACVAHKKRIGVYLSPLYGLRASENDLKIWQKVKDARHLIEGAGFRAVSYLRPDMAFRASHCMADSGGVTIGPDGSLYPCDHCQPETRYGDIFNGATDETVRREFCRVDRTREKCRTCPFLPDCTSLATCPVEDYHCRQVHELIAIDALKRMVEKKESDHIDGETPIC